MSKIKGIYAASMSIFNKNLSLNIEKTLAHAEKIIDQGCHGVAIFGSTGQAQLIPVNEKIALLNKLSKSRNKDNLQAREKDCQILKQKEVSLQQTRATYKGFKRPYHEYSPIRLRHSQVVFGSLFR